MCLKHWRNLGPKLKALAFLNTNNLQAMENFYCKLTMPFLYIFRGSMEGRALKSVPAVASALLKSKFQEHAALEFWFGPVLRCKEC